MGVREVDRGFVEVLDAQIRYKVILHLGNVIYYSRLYLGSAANVIDQS